MTISEACEAYLRDLKARNIRASTCYGYRSLFRQLGLLFYRLLQQAAKTEPVPRKTMIGGSPVQRVVREGAVE